MKNKLKFMKRMDDLSDEEVSQHMDFDGLLVRQHAAVKMKLYWKLGTLGVAVTGLVLLFYLMSHESTPNDPPTQSAAAPPPTLTDSIEAKLPQNVISKSDEVPSPSPQQKEEVNDRKFTVTEKQPVYRQAEPVNGYPALYDYFNRNLKYPSEVASDTIQGVVTVAFIVNIHGEPEQITAQNALGEPFEKEAIRLIRAMPRWKPATLDEKPVPSKISLPLTFVVDTLK